MQCQRMHRSNGLDRTRIISAILWVDLLIRTSWYGPYMFATSHPYPIADNTYNWSILLELSSGTDRWHNKWRFGGKRSSSPAFCYLWATKYYGLGKKCYRSRYRDCYSGHEVTERQQGSKFILTGRNYTPGCVIHVCATNLYPTDRTDTDPLEVGVKVYSKISGKGGGVHNDGKLENIVVFHQVSSRRSQSSQVINICIYILITCRHGCWAKPFEIFKRELGNWTQIKFVKSHFFCRNPVIFIWLFVNFASSQHGLSSLVSQKKRTFQELKN